MYKVYLARNGFKVYIGYCKNNAKQNFYRVCKSRKIDYKKFDVSIIDSTDSKEIAKIVSLKNTVLALIYGYCNINKKNDKQARKEYEKLLKGEQNDK